MKLMALLLALALVPQRIVSGNAVTSDRDPGVRVILPKDVTYIGTDQWVLFGIANCQLFAFVEADTKNVVQRLFWVQFEGYVSSMPKLHHTYDSKDHATMGGMDFFVDTWSQSGIASKPDIKPLSDFIKAKGYAVPAGINSGSDEQHIYALIASKGYTIPPRLQSVRFVHTLDEQRKELMIIYSEPYAQDRELTADEQHALAQRAQQQVKIQPL